MKVYQVTALCSSKHRFFALVLLTKRIKLQSLTGVISNKKYLNGIYIPNFSMKLVKIEKKDNIIPYDASSPLTKVVCHTIQDIPTLFDKPFLEFNWHFEATL